MSAALNILGMLGALVFIFLLGFAVWVFILRPILGRGRG